jgi:putative holliday junction resolvase
MTKNPSHILMGLDFGMKRIGVAVGQTVTGTARALTTLKAKDGIPPWDKMDKLIKAWQPDALIVGIPLNMDGTMQSITKDALRFKEALEARYKIPVHGMDERLSTKDARERLFEEGGFKALQNGQVDSRAAQLILQNWLSQHKSSNL